MSANPAGSSAINEFPISGFAANILLRNRELQALVALSAAAVAGAAIVAGGWVLMNWAQQRITRDDTFDKLPMVIGPVVPVEQAQTGRAVFNVNCQSCHGPKGRGMPGLGKDLAASAFARGESDASLAAFIRQGRAADDPLNTTKVAMPPSGGNPTLTDAQVSSVVSYLRALQNPARMPALGAITDAELQAVLPVMPEPSAAETAAAAAEINDDEYDTADILLGKKLYAMSCVSCHGIDAKGLPKLGKDLVGSTFMRGLDDDQMIAFLNKGRSTSDPLNTTKVDMPPKGGNPSLNDDKLFAITAYLRWLQKHGGAS